MLDLYNDDCFAVFPKIATESIDAVICDLPYGVTQNSWDIPLDIDKLWREYKRVIKPNGAIILFGQGKFTAKLILSNEQWFRYSIIWDKQAPKGFLNANRMPMRVHEDILVFYKKLPTYNPQMVEGKNPSHARCTKGVQRKSGGFTNNNYGRYEGIRGSEQTLETNLKFPTSILSVKAVPPSKVQHPTEKPVELLEWLVKTYTNEGDTVLDNTMGVGSTGVACKNLGRNFIGIELQPEYYEIAERRLL